jgi:nucleoside-diphosphate-sugar epimerase
MKFTIPKKILVTGCAGFIGSNFVKQFKKEFPKTKVVGIDNLSTGRKEALSPSMAFYKGSVTNGDFVEKIFAKHKPSYVFHFAALPRVSYSLLYPKETSEANIIGTVVLLNASRKYKVRRFIYSSSSSVYGSAKKLPTRESENFPDPKSPYAVQKYVGEPFCKIFSNLFGLDTISLRYFNVFGPGQFGDSPYSTVVSAWLEALYFPKKKKGVIEGDGKQSRDFCYVDNVVKANILAMKSDKDFKGEVFNIAYGERTTVNKVKILIEKHSGKELNLEKRSARLGDVKHTHADISKAHRWFGYKPKIAFEDGLIKTIEWFKDRKKPAGN